MLHRDVKSGNVVLTEAFVPKIIDCGLSMLLKPDPAPDAGAAGAGAGAGAAGGSSLLRRKSNKTAFSCTGGVMGTPAYMCPKYAQTGKYGVKSDLYSFGCIVLEMLTGKLSGSAEECNGEPITDYVEERYAVLLPAACAHPVLNLHPPRTHTLFLFSFHSFSA